MSHNDELTKVICRCSGGKVVSLNIRFITFFSDSYQEITVNLTWVINGGRDLTDMQVREDVGLNHSTGCPISR